MTLQLLYRFLVGGALVSLFAAIGDVVRPKSFAGVFAAAPSIALATLPLTLHDSGAAFAATEARSMIIGAAACALYAWLCCGALWCSRHSVPVITLTFLALWFAAVAVGSLILGGAAS